MTESIQVIPIPTTISIPLDITIRELVEMGFDLEFTFRGRNKMDFKIKRQDE